MKQRYIGIDIGAEAIYHRYRSQLLERLQFAGQRRLRLFETLRVADQMGKSRISEELS